jgi:transitional endoplasmic reticulum ATPase
VPPPPSTLRGQAKMDEMDMSRGDTVVVSSVTKRRSITKTVCVVLPGEQGTPDNTVQMNRCVQENLRVRPGDTVDIAMRPDVQYEDPPPFVNRHVLV